ncbi:hypothetical protein INT48_005143 [Thamnidium elegans]|uniref:Uncharacterized protein n=1 Tax=Thamnidium elegans TaxID=101142 RepID=A0A8H7VSL1_9FUNG|nr:hypothetical protein INT48_005143 [Thamnidium elegans]
MGSKLSVAIGIFTTSCLLEDSVESIFKLKEEHLEKLKELRFASFPSENLPTSILKLVEEEDKAGMHQLGPFYE